jgi:hypothetical protein
VVSPDEPLTLRGVVTSGEPVASGDAVTWSSRNASLNTYLRSYPGAGATLTSITMGAIGFISRRLLGDLWMHRRLKPRHALLHCIYAFSHTGSAFLTLPPRLSALSPSATSAVATFRWTLRGRSSTEVRGNTRRITLSIWARVIRHLLAFKIWARALALTSIRSAMRSSPSP